MGGRGGEGVGGGRECRESAVGFSIGRKRMGGRGVGGKREKEGREKLAVKIEEY